MKQISISNIYNLTSMWERVSIPYQGFFSENEFNYCCVPNSDWPNRLWFKQAVNEQALKQAQSIMQSSPIKLIFPCWDDFTNSNYEFFDKMGFSQTTQQTGMSLRLQKLFSQEDALHLLEVKDENQAKIWSHVHSQSFGYVIRHDILLQRNNGIIYYLVHYLGQVIGTVCILQSEDVLGIHGLSIISEMRKKGVAEKVMAILLNNAMSQSIEYATLQASALGKGIYQRMGFVEDFIITNYILKEKE